MKKLIKYTGDKVFMFPSGAIATPERIENDYPAVLHFVHVIETDEAEEVCYAIQNLNGLRAFYNIEPSLSEEEAINKLQEIINTPEPVSTEPTPEERTAQALEAMASGQTTENAAALDILLTGEDE